MPQMAPLSWLILFIVFSCTLVIFNFFNYFSFLSTSPQQAQLHHISPPKMNWTW
uniref:ATP synthase complex subunit 8 n=1 Tax=Neoperlops gressitti TaxID=2684670 RepID=A0A6B9PUJ7_9NEOP|nr:ATP synthase F0 subunit 8 [Neoperlops gressitti]